MAEASSPLSSTPSSIINVALGSPAVSPRKQPFTGSYLELASDITEIMKSDIAEVLKPEPTTTTNGHGEGPRTPGSDGDGQSSVQKRKASVTKKSTPTKIPRRTLPVIKRSAKHKKWDAPFVYTDSGSPLANADLRAILLLPGAWDVLTEEEKKDILAKFPDETHIKDASTSDPRPNTVSLRNDDNFRYDCARYCENIELGRHDEEWLYQAWVAHEEHRRGDFDEFLREKFEEDWEVQLPHASKPKGSDSDRESEISAAQSPKKGKGKRSQPASETEDQETPPTKRHSRRPSIASQTRIHQDKITPLPEAFRPPSKLSTHR
ncbi:hypothetical protein N0V88_001347 [Collariella sp. IMI 366227]|nr:hypothetical protein N0V88_001347 [Collariella sp. IMI 366227]